MKPARPSSTSFMHWLGRQVGHVRKAVRTRVGEQVIYRKDAVSERPLPEQPDVTLRRTTIDEVIVRDDAQSS